MFSSVLFLHLFLCLTYKFYIFSSTCSDISTFLYLLSFCDAISYFILFPSFIILLCSRLSFNRFSFVPLFLYTQKSLLFFFFLLIPHHICLCFIFLFLGIIYSLFPVTFHYTLFLSSFPSFSSASFTISLRSFFMIFPPLHLSHLVIYF